MKVQNNSDNSDINWDEAPEWANSIAVCDYNDFVANHFKGDLHWMAAKRSDNGTPGYFVNYKPRPE